MKQFLKDYAVITLLAVSQLYLIIAKLIGYTPLPWYLVLSPILIIFGVLALIYVVHVILRYYIGDTYYED